MTSHIEHAWKLYALQVTIISLLEFLTQVVSVLSL